MKKNIFVKATLASLSLVLISAVGFDTAFGYGSSSTRRSSGSSSKVIKPLFNEAPVPQVLGAENFRFLVNLRKDVNSSDVKELQARLRKEGLFTFPTDTGYFGPVTFAAVKAYQTAHPSIGYINGFVGPLTRAELNK